jgi:hypothetical protein
MPANVMQVEQLELPIANLMEQHYQCHQLDSAIFSASIFTGQKNVLVVAG